MVRFQTVSLILIPGKSFRTRQFNPETNGERTGAPSGGNSHSSRHEMLKHAKDVVCAVRQRTKMCKNNFKGSLNFGNNGKSGDNK